MRFNRFLMFWLNKNMITNPTFQRETRWLKNCKTSLPKSKENRPKQALTLRSGWSKWAKDHQSKYNKWRFSCKLTMKSASKWKTRRNNGSSKSRRFEKNKSELVKHKKHKMKKLNVFRWKVMEIQPYKLITDSYRPSIRACKGSHKTYRMQILKKKDWEKKLKKRKESYTKRRKSSWTKSRLLTREKRGWRRQTNFWPKA